MLRNTIQPLFEQSWETVRGLNRDVDVFSASDMARLTEITDQLSDLIWGFTLIGVFVSGVVF